MSSSMTTNTSVGDLTPSLADDNRRLNAIEIRQRRDELLNRLLSRQIEVDDYSEEMKKLSKIECMDDGASGPDVCLLLFDEVLLHGDIFIYFY